MAINIIEILNSIIGTENETEDITPFYIPEQKDMMDYMDFNMSIKYPFKVEQFEDNEEYADYFEEFYAPLSYSNANSKARHRNHRKHMIADKKKLHARKEMYGTYRNLNFHSDGWMADYAKEQYSMGNRRVRQTYDVPTGKAGYKKLNGKGIW